jgi:hypothetical protein
MVKYRDICAAALISDNGHITGDDLDMGNQSSPSSWTSPQDLTAAQQAQQAKELVADTLKCDIDVHLDATWADLVAEKGSQGPAEPASKMGTQEDDIMPVVEDWSW